MVTQHEITKAAEAKARRILQDAEAEAVERKGVRPLRLRNLTALEITERTARCGEKRS